MGKIAFWTGKCIMKFFLPLQDDPNILHYCSALAFSHIFNDKLYHFSTSYMCENVKKTHVSVYIYLMTFLTK